MSNKEIVIPVSKIKTKAHVNSFDDVHLEIEAEEEGLDLNKPNMIVLGEGKIAVKFPKLIQLIATHEFEEILDKHEMEDVIISADLLVDLAGTAPVIDEVEENKFSVMFVGVVIGLILSTIIFLLFLK